MQIVSWRVILAFFAVTGAVAYFAIVAIVVFHFVSKFW